MDELYILTELEAIETSFENIVANTLANLGLAENMHTTDKELCKIVMYEYEVTKGRIADAKSALNRKISNRQPKHD